MNIRIGKNRYRRDAACGRLKSIIAFSVLVSLCLVSAMPISAMDLARAETRTDLAVSTFGVSGQGVIVAILDRGIDWRNNDFRNSDGTTRIKYIFDLTDNTGAGAPGNTYGRGTIYTEAEINSALTGGPTLATRDAVGHGTNTAGIAAGNGRNLAGQKYRGIAPNATIIVVKVTSEGAPAHDGEPAEAPFNDATAYPVAIDFVKDKAAQLGKPAVMLLNLGSIGGPTDGTSSLSRKIDATVGPGKPGLVFVSGSGDDGGMPNHAGGTVTQGGTSSIQIQKGAAGTALFDLWYGGNDRFNVSIQTPSGNFGPYTSPATNGQQDFVTTSVFNYYHQGSSLVFYGATNGKREVFIQLTGPVGTYTVQLQGATVSNGRFDATLNPSSISQQAATSNKFLNLVVPGSIWDGATAAYNICPNDYVVRTNWTDIDGIPRSNTGQGSVGQIWTGSSVGPAFDGRLGVDISAPGDSVFTTLNPTSYDATFRFNKIQDGLGFYGRQNAVSAAAPQVTGLIALMLEKNPRLDAAQVKRMLHTSARHDAFTGTVPNATWGYGKMDSFNAVALAVKRPQFEFDGDGKADISIFRPSTGAWYLQQSQGGLYGTLFGFGTDKIAPADYDGDGKTDIAVYRPSTGIWYVYNSGNGTVSYYVFGLAEDLPVPADYDGDGKADIAVFRPSTGTWYRQDSSNGAFHGIQFGASEDKPTIGDFDGDGKSDIAIFRPSTGAWYRINSGNGSIYGELFGFGSDVIVPADYDGDGKTDLAVFRPSNGIWYLKNSSNSTYDYKVFGLSSDIPAPGDFDGDGKADISVFRPSDGTWYRQNSSNGDFIAFQFGANGDKPTMTSFRY